MSAHRVFAAFAFAGALVVSGPASAAFRDDMNALVAAAVREAPSDFSNISVSRDPKTGNDMVAPFGPSIARCMVVYLEHADGMPKALMCQLKPIPDAALAARRADIEAAANANGFSSWTKDGDASGTRWTQGQLMLELDVDKAKGKKKLHTLYLGYALPPHLRYLALGPGVAHFLDVGLAATADKFESIPAIEDQGDGFYGVGSPGDAFPACRKFAGMLECFSADLVDDADAQLEAAKEAVAAALPSGYSLTSCGRNVGDEPVCDWRGPNNVLVRVLIQQSNAKGSTLNFIRLSIDTDAPAD